MSMSQVKPALVFLFVCLSVCLFVCLSVCLFVCLLLLLFFWGWGGGGGDSLFAGVSKPTRKSRRVLLGGGGVL